jgi:hypothetical protein
VSKQLGGRHRPQKLQHLFSYHKVYCRDAESNSLGKLHLQNAMSVILFESHEIVLCAPFQFQSFYNFRITNEYTMPPPHRLIGRCKSVNLGVCTDRANFSKHLAKIEPWRKVFLYDVAQLQDSNEKRALQFRHDLQEFLDLQSPLEGDMIWIKPGRAPASPARAKELQELKINICDEQYADLRLLLLKQAAQSAKWIRGVFLANPSVKVSSPEYFAELLESWHVDPCTESGTKRRLKSFDWIHNNTFHL